MVDKVFGIFIVWLVTLKFQFFDLQDDKNVSTGTLWDDNLIVKMTI